jgi:hypothetical protein
VLCPIISRHIAHGNSYTRIQLLPQEDCSKRKWLVPEAFAKATIERGDTFILPKVKPHQVPTVVIHPRSIPEQYSPRGKNLIPLQKQVVKRQTLTTSHMSSCETEKGTCQAVPREPSKGVCAAWQNDGVCAAWQSGGICAAWQSGLGGFFHPCELASR